MPLIGAMLGLCYHGQLSKELVHKVFSMGFLDEMDKHMTAIVKTIIDMLCFSFGHSTLIMQSLSPQDEMDALRLRESFMQLNRAVCIDMPEVRVPWFHEKYCQEIAEIGKCTSYILFHCERVGFEAHCYFQMGSIGRMFTMKFLKFFRIHLERTV